VKQIVRGADAFFGPWIASRTGGSFSPGRGVTIGLWDTETDLPVAGVLYEDWNGANIVAHIAAIPGKQWLTKSFLRAIFAYPFLQLRARTVTLIIASSNRPSRKFATDLGFRLASTLPDAHPSGDLCIYYLHHTMCRWIEPKEPHHGKI
jgi:RimJ/RimL family protein N-acetyltransferase